jgi:hypothetical protein
LAERQAAGERLHVSQRGDDLFRVRLERLGALEWAARRPDRDTGPARQKMKMQMEDLLAARRFVELLQQKPIGLHAGHDRAPDLLHRGHELRQILGIEIEERAFGMTSVWPSVRGITSMKASDTSSS